MGWSTDGQNGRTNDRFGRDDHKTAESYRGPDTMCPALFHTWVFSGARREAGLGFALSGGTWE